MVAVYAKRVIIITSLTPTAINAPPRTVEGAVSRPISEMTLKCKIEIAAMG